jgi:hypothetical protein
MRLVAPCGAQVALPYQVPGSSAIRNLFQFFHVPQFLGIPFRYPNPLQKLRLRLLTGASLQVVFLLLLQLVVA